MSLTSREFRKRAIIASVCFILLCAIVCGVVAFVRKPEYVTGRIISKQSDHAYEIQVELQDGTQQTWIVSDSVWRSLDLDELITRWNDGSLSVG